MRPRLPLAWCLAAAALFGASAPAARVLLSEVPPLTLAGLLYLGAALAVLPAARGAPRPPRPRRQWLLLAGIAGAGGLLGPALLLLALARSGAGPVSLWLNLEPVLTALLAALLFREPLGARALGACALIAAAGAAVGAAPAAGARAAALLATGACLCWALDNNLSSLVDAFTPAQVTLAKGAAAGSVNLAAGLALEGAPASARALVAALAVGAAGYGLSLVLYLRGTQQLGATRSQALFATAPFVGFALSWALLREPATPVLLGAALAMGAGVALLLSGRHEHEHEHQAGTHAHWHRHDDLHHDHAHDEPVPPATWHLHVHAHPPLRHSHPHDPDLHHRHRH